MNARPQQTDMSEPEPATDTGGERPESVDPADVIGWLRGGEAFTVLDVRNRDEFEEWHITGPEVEAVHTPHQQFIAARVQESTEDLLPKGPEPVLVVCGVGQASAEVAEQLRGVGVDARNLAGGMEAWARQYDAVELQWAGGTVLQYQRPSSGCLSYLVVSGHGEDRTAAVVDPLRAFADRYAAEAAEADADLRYAVDTHIHADHVSGARAVADETGAGVVLPAGVSEHGLRYDGYEPRMLSDGDCLELGDATLEAITLPGHTPEMLGYRLGDDEHGDLLFGGDSLFLDSVARPDLAVDGESEVASMARRLHDTLGKLSSLPEGTRLAPGHAAESTRPTDDGSYVTTLGAVRERLDVFNLDEATFVEETTESLPERPANDSEIRAINLGERSADAETAFELELGPNNCAAK
jgi:glyoxylase-like metal-dependent hydrolase (beta-lactamase superfamily II)/rhodanese-related sulfurtransferase